MIDIIIPVLNEEAMLIERGDFFRSLKPYGRLIFADGGSIDGSRDIAVHYGDVITTIAGRGVQKNAGAALGKNDILLFLHVDLEFDARHIKAIERSVEEGARGGCFQLAIDDPHFVFRLVEQAVNYRARTFGVLDGDLGMFVRRDVFTALGGFENLLYLEDLLFSRRLRKEGGIAVLPAAIKASSRKWHQEGFFRTLSKYMLAYGRYWSGQYPNTSMANALN